MKYRTIYYTEAQKTLMWDRWQKGESLRSIARLFERNHSSIEGILKQTGGIRPRPRRRSPVWWPAARSVRWPSRWVAQRRSRGVTVAGYATVSRC